MTPQWIDIKNKSIQPVEGERYWVTVNFVTNHVITALYRGGNWYFDGSQLNNVTAWYNVPEPEPYVSLEAETNGWNFPDFQTDSETGVNTAIQYHLLDAEEMSKAGFNFITNPKGDYWLYSKMLKDEISFSVSIPATAGKLKIDVLDEDFLQPYDYQSILSKNKNHKYAKQIMNLVEKEMTKLQEIGVLSGHIKGEYI